MTIDEDMEVARIVSSLMVEKYRNFREAWRSVDASKQTTALLLARLKTWEAEDTAQGKTRRKLSLDDKKVNPFSPCHLITNDSIHHDLVQEANTQCARMYQSYYIEEIKKLCPAPVKTSLVVHSRPKRYIITSFIILPYSDFIRSQLRLNSPYSGRSYFKSKSPSLHGFLPSSKG